MNCSVPCEYYIIKEHDVFFMFHISDDTIELLNDLFFNKVVSNTPPRVFASPIFQFLVVGGVEERGFQCTWMYHVSDDTIKHFYGIFFHRDVLK